jgi:hypothetical protein
MRCCDHSDRGTPPDKATPGGNNSLYCFNFLTQRVESLAQRKTIAIENPARDRELSQSRQCRPSKGRM